MTYEQLSYWEGFSNSSNWLFENMWDTMKSYLMNIGEDEDCTTGHWFINGKNASGKETSGVVIFVKDSQYDQDTLFVSRLTPAGFISRRQLFVSKDHTSGLTSYKYLEIRKNWKYFEFEPWESLTKDPQHLADLEFDISELALARLAQDSLTVKKLSPDEATTIYRKWF